MLLGDGAPHQSKRTTAADGYTVSGPALPAGEDAQYTVVVGRLPGADELAFKTLQTYSDGRVDHWIQLSKPGAPEPDNPATVLHLEPATAATTSPTTTPATGTAAPAAAAPTATNSAVATTADAGSSGLSAGTWGVIATAAVLVLAAAATYLMRRNRPRA